MPVWFISWKVQTEIEIKLVFFRKMEVGGKAVYKNHTHTLYIYIVICP